MPEGMPAPDPETAAIVARVLRARVGRIVAIVALMALGAGIAVATPLLYRQLLDAAVPARDGGQIARLLAAILALPLAATALTALQTSLQVGIGEEVGGALRLAAFDRVNGAALRTVARFKTADILSRLTRAAGEIGAVYIANQLLPALSNGLVLAGSCAAMVLLNRRLAALTALAFPLSYAFARRVRGRAARLDRELQDTLEAGTRQLQEYLAGFRAVRLAGGQAAERERWAGWNRRHGAIKGRSAVFHGFALALPLTLINSLVTGLVFGYGATEIVAGRLSVGELVAFVIYLPRAYAAFAALLAARIGAEGARVSAGRVDALLRLPAERATPGVRLPTTAGGAAIAFERVSFAHDRDGAGLAEVSFRVAPGEFLGIVGASGGGKSTLIDLLTGLYAPHAGRILVDGADLQSVALGDWRAQCGVVTQEVFLWDTSIRHNITYPERAGDEARIVAAARLAQLHDFITALPEGYDTIVGERGVQLSGGERQRLALCRALLRQPRLLLLDEFTAALDARTEGAIRAALRAAAGRTTIAVAHRLASVMEADRLLVIERGRVVEWGTPQELLARSGAFAALYAAQQGATAAGGALPPALP